MGAPDWTQLGGFGIAAAAGLRLVWKEVRTWSSESQAIKNLREEMNRQTTRIDSLEKKLDERDAEFEAERAARRAVEDLLDKEKRRSAALEDRIVELERDCGND